MKKAKELMKGCGNTFEVKDGYRFCRKDDLCSLCERARKQMLDDCKEFLSQQHIDGKEMRKHIGETHKTIKVLEGKNTGVSRTKVRFTVKKKAVKKKVTRKLK